ncbi:MAG TPA: BTAD domain-containing putative transcriptional regulator [Pyrinomonadaceae bacterium]|jgi:DNA-binding SARP family transcriptional activator
MTQLKISLFGKFSIESEGLSLRELESYKVQEFFCYLLLHRTRPHARETLANLLWGDSTTAQSKKYLRQALWQLQNTLAQEDAPEAERFLLVEPDWIRLNMRSDIWLDIEVFEQAFALVRGRPSHSLSAEDVMILKEAVALYRGDLLEGSYQDWCLYERERLQHMYMVLLDKITGFCEREQDYETGLNYATVIMRYDRARECTHRRLMRLYYLAGDRTSALRQYERCVTALREELGVKPARRTVELYEQIRRDAFVVGPAPSSAQSRPAPTAVETASPASLPEVIVRLRELQSLLTEIHRQVQQEIKTAELVFNRWQ